MLNPSTADAFKLDPTIKRCYEFARRWGFGVLDVVNLYSLRSSHPQALYRAIAREARGDDGVNDLAIYQTCANADLVIAAWGAHGDAKKLKRDGMRRGDVVRAELVDRRVRLHRLGLTKSGAPIHPLARGKSFVPYSVTAEHWPMVPGAAAVENLASRTSNDR